jgi:hypothetical protein
MPFLAFENKRRVMAQVISRRFGVGKTPAAARKSRLLSSPGSWLLIYKRK